MLSGTKYTWIRTCILLIPVCVFSQTIQAQTADLPLDISSLFAGSGRCAVCHVTDGSALMDSRGLDLSLSTDWRSTMMANAFRDPYWQAKVESEVNAFPALKAVIEDKCNTCHAPMGRTQAIFDGAVGYNLNEARENPLARDGVSCTLCHQIRASNLGEEDSFSGGYTIDDSRTIFGPYINVMDGAMRATVNYTSVFGEHLNSAELCAVCHTLYTPFVDDMGNIAGTFPEQVPYWEWRSSVYPAEGTTCQTCHLPRLEEPITISSIPPGLNPQSPFGQHYFVGGNAFMQQILKDEGDDIGVTAEEVQFDTTIARTLLQLRGAAALSTETASSDNTVRLDVTVENLAGHKFPTGFPSRRVWLHVVVTNEAGQTVFESGRADDEGRIVGLEAGLELHHDIISGENQVQIYESRMMDVNGELTFTLLRGADYIKDNRLPPKGFTSNAERYTDMAVQGDALDDPNFNRSGGVEGSGKDNVTYQIDVTGETGTLTAVVELLYQAINPAFIDDLDTHETPAVDRFMDYYVDADKTPVVVQSIETSVTLEVNTGLEGAPEMPEALDLLQNFPNPFYTSTVIPFSVSNARAPVSLRIFDLQGRLVRVLLNGTKSNGRYYEIWDGKDDGGQSVGSGLYVCRLTVGEVSQTKTLVHVR